MENSYWRKKTVQGERNNIFINFIPWSCGIDYVILERTVITSFIEAVLMRSFFLIQRNNYCNLVLADELMCRLFMFEEILLFRVAGLTCLQKLGAC